MDEWKRCGGDERSGRDAGGKNEAAGTVGRASVGGRRTRGA